MVKARNFSRCAARASTCRIENHRTDAALCAGTDSIAQQNSVFGCTIGCVERVFAASTHSTRPRIYNDDQRNHRGSFINGCLRRCCHHFRLSHAGGKISGKPLRFQRPATRRHRGPRGGEARRSRSRHRSTNASWATWSPPDWDRIPRARPQSSADCLRR